jgi:hypothetical protein
MAFRLSVCASDNLKDYLKSVWFCHPVLLPVLLSLYACVSVGGITPMVSWMVRWGGERERERRAWGRVFVGNERGGLALLVEKTNTVNINKLAEAHIHRKRVTITHRLEEGTQWNTHMKTLKTLIKDNNLKHRHVYTQMHSHTYTLTHQHSLQIWDVWQRKGIDTTSPNSGETQRHRTNTHTHKQLINNMSQQSYMNRAVKTHG